MVMSMGFMNERFAMSRISTNELHKLARTITITRRITIRIGKGSDLLIVIVLIILIGCVEVVTLTVRDEEKDYGKDKEVQLDVLVGPVACPP